MHVAAYPSLILDSVILDDGAESKREALTNRIYIRERYRGLNTVETYKLKAGIGYTVYVVVNRLRHH